MYLSKLLLINVNYVLSSQFTDVSGHVSAKKINIHVVLDVEVGNSIHNKVVN